MTQRLRYSAWDGTQVGFELDADDVMAQLNDDLLYHGDLNAALRKMLQQGFKDRNGERQKRTEWHKIVVWGKQAEIAQQYLKKGSLVFIEGRIQSREWQDKEGQKRTSFEIVANNFRMLGGRSDAAAAGAAAGGTGGGASRGGEDVDSGGHSEDAGGGPGPSGPEISDEDIPF